MKSAAIRLPGVVADASGSGGGVSAQLVEGRKDAPPNTAYRLVMLWPLDPNANQREALTEAAHRIADIAADHGLRLRHSRYTVLGPDATIGRQGWLLAYEGTGHRRHAVDVGSSPSTPYLPIDVVVQDGTAHRLRTPERGEAIRRISGLRAQGYQTADIAALVNVAEPSMAVRTVQRMSREAMAV